VLHREGSDHLITPEAAEQPAATSGGDVDFTRSRLEDKFRKNEPMRSTNVASMPSAAPGAREMAGSSEFSGSAYGNPRAQATPPRSASDPEAYRKTRDNEMAPGSGPYPTRSCQRLRDFEDHLKRNRVDVTASCRACGVQREKAA
jgi:hypothetical protein